MTTGEFSIRVPCVICATPEKVARIAVDAITTGLAATGFFRSLISSEMTHALALDLLFGGKTTNPLFAF
jgi:hypothetical protein